MGFDTPWHKPRKCKDCGFTTDNGNDWKGHHYRVCPKCGSMDIELID
jgi:predicted Zn-ribbon and HTH transcriptional regulator